jgi:hypothetical protein
VGEDAWDGDGVTRRCVTAPFSVRAVDLGGVITLLDVRTGQIHALAGPSGRAWAALAQHSDIPAAAAGSGIRTTELSGLADELTRLGLLVESHTPNPWPAPVVAAASEASWGTRTVPVRLEPLARPVLHLRLLAFLALAVTLVARQAGRGGHSFGRLVRLAALSAVRARQPATPTEAADAVHAIRRAARWWPARVACLEESISTTVLLGLRRRHVIWSHGVAADPIHLHAWVEADGRPVAEPESTSRYTPLLRIPDVRP